MKSISIKETVRKGRKKKKQINKDRVRTGLKAGMTGFSGM